MRRELKDNIFQEEEEVEDRKEGEELQYMQEKRPMLALKLHCLNFFNIHIGTCGNRFEFTDFLTNSIDLCI